MPEIYRKNMNGKGENRPKFEAHNNILVNVAGFKDETFFPLLVSKNITTSGFKCFLETTTEEEDVNKKIKNNSS